MGEGFAGSILLQGGRVGGDLQHRVQQRLSRPGGRAAARLAEELPLDLQDFPVKARSSPWRLIFASQLKTR